MSFFRVENAVSCAPSIEYFITLGLSSSRGNDSKIGMHGSGIKHTIALFTRFGIKLKICLGSDVYTPEIQIKKVTDSLGNVSNKEFIYLKKQGGGTYDLNMTTDFGGVNWNNPSMGVREIITNAIDGIINIPYSVLGRKDGTYLHTLYSMSISECDEAQCRAKEGFVRVYFESTPQTRLYISLLPKMSLYFTKNYNKDQQVLINEPNDFTRFYRKGILVHNTNKVGMFSYNIPDIPVDESRNVDSWAAQKYASRALMLADIPIKEMYLKILKEPTACWERNNIQGDYLLPTYWDDNEISKDSNTIKSEWREANKNVFGNSVLTKDKIYLEQIKHKGYKPELVSDEIYNLIRDSGGQVDSAILTENEMQGKKIFEATPTMYQAFNAMWDLLSKNGLTNDLDKPNLLSFQKDLGECATLGYYQQSDQTVYLHSDIDVWSKSGQEILLEELGHHITKAADYSRAFQNWLIKAAISFMGDPR